MSVTEKEILSRQNLRYESNSFYNDVCLFLIMGAKM